MKLFLPILVISLLQFGVNPSSVQVKINKTTVIENESAQFECATSGGNPELIHRYQWLWKKSGSTTEQIIQDTKTSTDSGKLLEFARIPYDRSGTYSCKAWNQGRMMGQASTDLNVQYSPRIDQEAKMIYDVAGKMGKEASFELFIIANPLPNATDYIWSKDGNILSNSSSDYEITSGPKSSELIIKNVTSSDYAKYTCSVKTSGFQAKIFMFKLFKAVAHNVHVKINKSTVNEHEFVRFECATSGGNPELITRYQWLWKKNGSTTEQVIQDTKTSTHNGKFLEFARIPYDKSGTYSCKAWNQGGTGQASTVLNVLYSPRIDSEAKIKYDVAGEMGKDATFELFIIANPTPNETDYIWSKDGNILSNSSSDYEINSGPMSSKLIIKNVTSSDYTNYTCSVNTSEFQVKVFKFELLKAVPHNVQVKISRTIVSEHEFVRFECATSGGYPELVTRYQWLWKKSGSTTEQVIQDTETGTQDGKFLEFARIPYDKSGTYSCKAWNQGGMGQASTVLNVQYSPRIDPEAKMKHDVAGEMGKGASFELFITANPTPSATDYIWSKDGNILSYSSQDYDIISGMTSSKLIIKKVTSSDYTYFTCSVKTSGFQAKGFMFKLLNAESPQTSNIGVSRTDNKVILSWKPVAGKYTAIKIRYCQTGTEDCAEYIVPNPENNIAVFFVDADKTYYYCMVIEDGDNVVYRSYQLIVDDDKTNGVGERVVGGLLVGAVIIAITWVVVAVVLWKRGLVRLGKRESSRPANDTEDYDATRVEFRTPRIGSHCVPAHGVLWKKRMSSDCDVDAYESPMTWQQDVSDQNPVPKPLEDPMEFTSPNEQFGQNVSSGLQLGQKGTESEGTNYIGIVTPSEPGQSEAESSSNQSDNDVAHDQGSPYAHLDLIETVSHEYLDLKQSPEESKPI